MATQTTHYNLTKPDLTDLVDVTVLNDNADIIDDAIYAASQSGGAAMIESSVEATTTSAHAYAVGDHFIYNNTLYAVTAAIAVGDTITPDTNCVATTVMDEVEAGGGGTSDYTQLSNKPQINGNTLTGNQTGAQLGLVDAVSGKGLSSNDYTTAEKEKLEGIAAGAEANVQSDWNQADSTADDYIKNRTHYAVPAWTQKISADLHPISGESVRKLCGQGTAGVQTLTNGKLYKVTLGTKVWTGYPTKYTWTAYEYAYFLETDIGLTLEDEHDDNPSWAGWKAYITTGEADDWYAHLTIEENSGENVTKLDNKYLDMDSAPASGSAKPVTSGGVYTALTGKISTTAKGAANGVASLDSSGKVPSGQLPSYVDDVIEGYYYNGAFYSDSAHTQEITGEAGKIYVDLSTEDSYRWSGSVYVKIANQIEIDATLTQQGEAADAKAVGDEISDVRNTLNQIVSPNAGSHNSIFRGKYLGDSYTAEQREEITAGIFNDLFIGDYWTIDGIDYVICHFDYYYKCSDSNIDYHHVVLMPRGNMTGLSVTAINSESVANGTFQWGTGTSHTTAGGYIGSRMRTVIMPACDNKVKSAFGASYVHAVSELYPSSFASTTDGRAAGWAWTSTDLICDLCNETMVYGCQVWGQGSAFGNMGYEVCIDKWQLAIFRLYPQFANIRSGWWLRSVNSASSAAYVDNYGYASHAGAALAFGVRPRFLLS